MGGRLIQINAGELPGLLGGQLKRTARSLVKEELADLMGTDAHRAGREVCIHGGRSRVAAKTLQPGICGSSALQKRNTHSG